VTARTGLRDDERCRPSAMKPIRLPGGVPGSMSSRMAWNTTLNWASWRFSRASSFWARSALDSSICLSRTNARMISMLTRTARELRRTLESIATPCSVKAWGGYLRCAPRPVFKVTSCDLKAEASSLESSNMKSGGNRSRFRRTAWLRTLTATGRALPGGCPGAHGDHARPRWQR